SAVILQRAETGTERTGFGAGEVGSNPAGAAVQYTDQVVALGGDISGNVLSHRGGLVGSHDGAVRLRGRAGVRVDAAADPAWVVSAAVALALVARDRGECERQVRCPKVGDTAPKPGAPEGNRVGNVAEDGAVCHGQRVTAIHTATHGYAPDGRVVGDSAGTQCQGPGIKDSPPQAEEIRWVFSALDFLERDELRCKVAFDETCRD